MLLAACGVEHPAVQRLGTTPEAMIGHLKEHGKDKALKVCQLLLSTRQGIKHGVEPRLQLEMALVRIAGMGRMVDYDTSCAACSAWKATHPATS